MSILTDRIDETIWRLSLVLTSLLMILYLALFYIIRQANKTINQQRSELEKHQLLLESTNDAVLTEINIRKKAERDLAQLRQGKGDTKLLPLVNQICTNSGKAYLRIAGADRIGEVKDAYASWRKNKVLGPNAINIFIILLSKNLDGQQKLEFESKAQDCIRL